MKVALFSNNGTASQKVVKNLEAAISETDLEINAAHPDVVITIGGDGTLLSAFHHYIKQLPTVRFVGIHTGHLGFYTDWHDYEVADLVDSLVNDNGESVNYPLLDVTIRYNDVSEPDRLLALNESTFKKLSGTMVADVYIKDELFERYRGDGLCISTPTGSTAYNKSVGGAILNPQLDAIQMSEIASINNRVFRALGSPLILPPDEWITIQPIEMGDNVITCDQLSVDHREIASITYHASKQRIAFASYRHTQFWKRVSESFIGVMNNEADGQNEI